MTAEQGSMFELGDADGDALTYVTEDGAHVTAPSLLQQGDAPTAAQLDADRRAAAFVKHHRAHVAENLATVDLATALPRSDDTNQPERSNTP